MTHYDNLIYAELSSNQKKIKAIVNDLDYLKQLLQFSAKEETEKNNHKFQRFCEAMQDVINNPEQYS